MKENSFEKVKKYGIKCAVCAALEKVGILKLKLSDLYIQQYFLNLLESRRDEELKIWFQSETGNKLNLRNPQKFNEKIQWLKLYDSTPIKTRLADKYLVRDWVKEKIGEQYLIPLLGVWGSFAEIDFKSLPEQYVLKCVHGSGMNVIVRKEKPLDKKNAKKKIDYWMRFYYGIGPMQEWHYRDIPHRIIAEQYMENISGDLFDYKFYCFNGEPKYIQVIKGRNNDSQMTFYDLDWKDAGFSYLHFGVMKSPAARPSQLNKAIEIARILSSGFSFVRVDLYLIGDNDIYFGEMTFTPASGVRHWIPEGTDKMLGDLIELPKDTYRLK